MWVSASPGLRLERVVSLWSVQGSAPRLVASSVAVSIPPAPASVVRSSLPESPSWRRHERAKLLPAVARPKAFEDRQQARYCLFGAISSFLRRVAGGQPLLIVLDDLHWADAGSLLLLEFVARELAGSRVLLLGTYRDVELSRTHPLSCTLTDPPHERLVDLVALRGLSEVDVGSFIEAIGMSAPSRDLVEAIHDRTEGNPLSVGEIVRLRR